MQNDDHHTLSEKDENQKGKEHGEMTHDEKNGTRLMKRQTTNDEKLYPSPPKSLQSLQSRQRA